MVLKIASIVSDLFESQFIFNVLFSNLYIFTNSTILNPGSAGVEGVSCEEAFSHCLGVLLALEGGDTDAKSLARDHSA